MIGQFFNKEFIKTLTKYSTTQISLPAGTQCLVGGLGVITDAALLASVSTTGLGGLDVGTVAANTLYYVYLVVSSNTAGLVLSLSSTAPTGFLCYKVIGFMYTDGSSQVGMTSSKGTSDWFTCTPVFENLGTVAIVEFFYRKVNNELKLKDRVKIGTPGSANALIVLPSGLSVDSRFLSGSIKSSFGYYNQASPTGSDRVTIPNLGTFGTVNHYYNDATRLLVMPRASTDNNDLANFFFSAGMWMYVDELSIPIAGWESDKVISQF